MNIVVCMKQVPDSETRVKIAADGKSVDLSSVNYVINPFDEFAIEEAVRLKEKFGGEVTIVTLGPERSENDIRKAMAMGADKGVLLKADAAFNGNVAYALSDAIKSLPYDLILFGKQAIDDDSAQMPQMVAELLDLPCVTTVVKLEINNDSKNGTAEREIEGGLEVIEFPLPVVIGTQKGINEPRLPNLKGIMAAKKKPMEKKEPALMPSPYEIIGLELPPTRAAGKIVGKGAEAVPELVRLLHEEAKMI
jgi:electron transfer flavoprotein beta subunit